MFHHIRISATLTLVGIVPLYTATRRETDGGTYIYHDSLPQAPRSGHLKRRKREKVKIKIKVGGDP